MTLWLAGRQTEERHFIVSGCVFAECTQCAAWPCGWPSNRGTTLLQLAFLGESDPDFPWEKFHWDNKVYQKKKKSVQNIKNTKYKTVYGCVLAGCMRRAAWPCGWRSSTSTSARCPAPAWPSWRCWAATASSCAPTSTPGRPCWLTGCDSSPALVTSARSSFESASRKLVSSMAGTFSCCGAKSSFEQEVGEYCSQLPLPHKFQLLERG